MCVSILQRLFFKWTSEGILLLDTKLFEMIQDIKPGKRVSEKGEIDVYGVVNVPNNEWRVHGDPDSLFVLNGTFRDTVQSLNNVQFPSKSSPTTEEFKDIEFFSNAIFEATTGIFKLM